jgi:hypothetical protein
VVVEKPGILREVGVVGVIASAILASLFAELEGNAEDCPLMDAPSREYLRASAPALVRLRGRTPKGLLNGEYPTR